MFDTTRITDKKKEILILSIQGNSAQAISEKIFLGKNTIKSHLAEIYQILGVSGMSGRKGRDYGALTLQKAMIAAVKQGIVTIGEIFGNNHPEKPIT